MASSTQQGDSISVARVLNQRQVHTFFQPLVHLADGEVVGFEALSRGPKGTDLENPLALFDAAKEAGRLEELDWLCASSAFAAAHAAKLHPSMTIFLNFKPGTLTSPYPDDLSKDIIRARKQSRVVAEIDEEDLRNEPALVLEAASRARADGWGVALDNVGATPASLALLPILHPDVVKLDLRVLAQHRGHEAAEIETTVRTYAEMSGAAILAQRVETELDVLEARGYGCTYGEGWHYGRPDLLPQGERRSTGRVPLPAHSGGRRLGYALRGGAPTPGIGDHGQAVADTDQLRLRTPRTVQRCPLRSLGLHSRWRPVDQRRPHSL